MQNLFIEQKEPTTGVSKAWRLRAEQGSATFGTSKHAELRSGSDGVKGIHGLFEYRHDRWWYVHLDPHSSPPQFEKGMSEICIDKSMNISVGVSTLQITPYDARSALFSSMESADSGPGPGKSPYQLFTVYQNGRLLESQVVPMNRWFTPQADLKKSKVQPKESREWVTTQIGDLEVNQRTLYLSSVESLSLMSKDQFLDDGSKKSLIVGVCLSLVLALAFLITPPKEDAKTTLYQSTAPLRVQEVNLTPPPRKKSQGGVAKVPTQKQAAPTPSTASNEDSGGSKVASVLKAFSGTRLSQLVGKVSAQPAKSNNVVVSTNGIAAGTATSGRALAALGKVNQDGKDWKGDAKAVGVKLNTVGQGGGGKGVGGLGTLSTGKTGNGGVGLIEEESEVVGGLDREVIAGIIKTQLGQILYCYERQLSAQPDLFGKVVVKFTIGPKGEVETQSVGETSLRNATVENCIMSRIARWKFPAPKGGTSVSVTYPFLFKSTN